MKKVTPHAGYDLKKGYKTPKSVEIKSPASHKSEPHAPDTPQATGILMPQGKDSHK